MIKAQFAKQPLVEELERVEKTSEDIRNMELAKIKELCAATKKQFVPEYYDGLPLDFLRDEIESLQMRQANYKSDEYKEDTQHRVK